MNPEISHTQSSRLYPSESVNPDMAVTEERSSLAPANAMPYLDAIVTFTYNATMNRDAYEADPQHPDLAVPQEVQQSSQPYGLAERQLILNAFSRRVTEILKEKEQISDEQVQLILLSFTTGAPISDPQLAILAKTVGDQAMKEIQVQTNLPASWNPLSVEPKDWTPSSIPIGGILNPTAVNRAQTEMLLSNVTKLLESMGKAADNLADELPPDISSVFRKVIAQTVRALKEMLQEIQRQDAESSHESQKSKLDAIEGRSRALEAQIKKSG
jgi:hypothetical protein